MYDDIHTLRRRDSAVRRLWREFRGKLPSDILDDCLVEGELTWWRVVSSGRLASVPSGSHRAFLLESVRNAVLDFLESAGRAASHETAAAADPFPVATDRPDEVERLALNRYVRGRHLADQVTDDTLEGGLRELMGRDRDLLDLAYRDGLEDAEIAQVLGCSTSAAKKARQRALARLRQLMRAPPAARGRLTSSRPCFPGTQGGWLAGGLLPAARAGF